MDQQPTQRRPTLRTLRALLRNPLESWPPEIRTVPLLRTRFLRQETVFVADPELIGQVLNTQASAFAKAETMTRALAPALGQGLLTADGAHWRWQRQATAPAFRHERLMGFLPAMLAAARGTRERLRAMAPGTAVELGHEMMQVTFAIILETMLSGDAGIDPARVERGMADYLDSTTWSVALALAGAPHWMPYPGRWRAARASAYLRREVLRLVASRREAAEQPDDLIGLLLSATDPETGRAMADGELADNLLTFVAAGHETTALALAWTFHLLGRHPAVVERALAEIEAVTGGGEMEPAHVPRLAYTRQVIQEAMRLYPPAAIIVRRAERDVELGGHRIGAGASCYVPVHAVHRRPSLWPEPERFDPDRFAPDAVRARHRYAYLPFGAGPRICIGAGFAMLEAVAILATLLPAVRLEPVPGAPEPVPLLRITLRPSPGITMRAYPRGPL